MPSSPFLPLESGGDPDRSARNDRGAGSRPEGPRRRASDPADAEEWPARPEPRRDLYRQVEERAAQFRAFPSQLLARASRARRSAVDDRGTRRGRLPKAAMAALALVVVALAGGLAGRASEGLSRRASDARSADARSAVASSSVPAAVGGLPLIVGAGPSIVPVASSSPLTHPSSSVVAPTSTALAAVHAAGAEVHPGVYLLPPGARVDDVLAAAGGATPDADLDSVNLAEAVVDGERVAFPRRGQPVPTITAPTRASTPVAGTGAAAPTNAPLLDLNAATAAELDALPGVGPATAAAILTFRAGLGRFRQVAQLLDVPGIGDAKLAALRPRVRV